LADPETIADVDYMICESTYGGRLHSKDKTVEEVLIENIKHSCIDTPGRLIIPAFSIGRTQALVYSINKIFAEKKLPPIKVFVDSPLGMAGTDIYRKHHHLLNDSAKAFYQSNGDQFTFDSLDYIETLNESKQISDYFEPCIIISSAGMLEGGRIQDHLYFNLQNYYCTILFIGYCAKGTLGRKLLDGIPMVKIYGRELYVFASIKQTDLFSAHADQDGLLNFIMATPPSKLKKVFLVHGEKSSMQQLAAVLHEKEYQVCIPQKGKQFIL
jgi:metallo-beta-lactamase family protein